jgi:hypothetical protein
MYQKDHTQPSVNFFGQSSRLTAQKPNGNGKPAIAQPTRRLMNVTCMPNGGAWSYNAFGKGNWKDEEGMLFSNP